MTLTTIRRTTVAVLVEDLRAALDWPRLADVSSTTLVATALAGR